MLLLCASLHLPITRPPCLHWFISLSSSESSAATIATSVWTPWGIDLAAATATPGRWLKSHNLSLFWLKTLLKILPIAERVRAFLACLDLPRGKSWPFRTFLQLLGLMVLVIVARGISAGVGATHDGRIVNRVYLAAIAACHVGFDGKSVGQYPLISCFMEGAHHLQPVL